MKSKRLYAVLDVIENAPVKIGSSKAQLKMSWTDGMIGVLSVFSNLKKAKKYGGKTQIIKLERSEE